MKISRRRLLDEAQVTGFRPEVLEKVIQLLNLLQGFNRHPFLKGKLALKGGTALNLFLFDLPRLSVDIDLNYIGSIKRETMIEDRPKIEQAVQAVCSCEGMNITQVPCDHAGGKWQLRYDSSIGESGNLEVDLNFMFHLPLWAVIPMDATVGNYNASQIPVLDIHELAAGKFAALLARRASRDLFDAHHILTKIKLEIEKFRLGFVLYGAMNRKDWRTVSVDDIDYDKHEPENQLVPVVRRKVIEKSLPTNNGSERKIRHTVIDRKITQGTRGDSGMRWCERIWSTIATCKKQKRDVFEFIYQSILAHWNNKQLLLLL